MGLQSEQKCPPVTQERPLVRQVLVNVQGQGQGTGKKHGGWGGGEGESRGGVLSLLSPVIHFSIGFYPFLNFFFLSNIREGNMMSGWH